MSEVALDIPIALPRLLRRATTTFELRIPVTAGSVFILSTKPRLVIFCPSGHHQEAHRLIGMEALRSLLLLRFFWLSVILGRIWNLWELVYRYLTLFRYSVTTQITEGDAPYEWVVVFVHHIQGRTCTHSSPSCLCATSSLRKWSLGAIPDSLKGPSDTDRKGDMNVGFDDYEPSDYFRWKGHWAKMTQSKKRSKENSTRWTPRNLSLTIYASQTELLSGFVEDARQHWGEPVKLEPLFVVQPVAQLLGGSRPSEKQEAFIQTVIRELDDPMDGPSTARNFKSYLLDGPPGTGKTSTMHALAAALGVKEIHTLVLGNEPDVAGPDPRSKMEDMDRPRISRSILAQPPYYGRAKPFHVTS